jgi:hypothetical protein
VDEYNLYEAMQLGSTGSYSSIALMNPSLMLDFFAACTEGPKEKAEALSARLKRFHDQAIYPIYASFNEQGYWDSAIDRLEAMLNPHVKCGLRCRRPYRFSSEDELAHLKSWVLENDPGLLSS